MKKCVQNSVPNKHIENTCAQRCGARTQVLKPKICYLDYLTIIPKIHTRIEAENIILPSAVKSLEWRRGGRICRGLRSEYYWLYVRSFTPGLDGRLDIIYYYPWRCNEKTATDGTQNCRPLPYFAFSAVAVRTPTDWELPFLVYTHFAT